MNRTPLDRDSGVPLYRQIKQILIEELRNADVEEGPLMTEVELVDRFRVSRAPVRQALKELVDEGYVYRERAKGTFPVAGLNVRRPPALELGGLTRYLREQGLETASRVSDVGRVRPPEDVRVALDLGSDEEIFHLKRLISVKGEPLVWVLTYLCTPPTFAPTAGELEEAGSVFGIAERETGLALTRGEHQIWATGATAEEADILQVRRGQPVLVMATTMYTREGQVGGWRRAVHRANDYKYVFTVTR